MSVTRPQERIAAAPALRLPAPALAPGLALIWLAALALYTAPLPVRLAGPALAGPLRDAHQPEIIDGRPALFTRERPELPLPRRTAGPALIDLTLRAPDGAPARSVAVRLGGSRAATLPVGQEWRRYRLLIPGDAALADGSALVLETQADRFARDDRRIGVALASVAITPDRAGPRWPGLAFALPLLAALALAAALIGRLGAPAWLALAGGLAALAALEPAVGQTRAGPALAAAVLTGGHLLLSAARAPAPRLALTRRWHWLAGGTALIAALGLALAAPDPAALGGAPALTLRIGLTVGTMVLVVCYAGFGLAWFLREPWSTPALPLVVPMVGLAALSAAGHALALLPVGTDVTTWPLIGVFTLVNALAWRRGARPHLARSHTPALALGALGLVLALMPLYQVGYLTTLGGTIDALSYVSRAEQIQRSGLMVAPPTTPLEPIPWFVASQIETGMRQGDTFILGLFSSLLGMRPHEIFAPLLAVWHALAPLGAYLVARHTLHAGRRAAFLGGLLVAAHPLLHWAVMDNFFSQAVGTGAWLFALAAVGWALRGGARSVILAGLLVAALGTFYHAYLAFLAPVAVLAGLAELWRERQGGARPLVALWRVAARGLGVAAAALLVMPAAWALALRAARLLSGQISRAGIAPEAVGNILVFPHPAEIVGVVNHAQAAYGLPLPQMPGEAAWALLGACAALGLYGAARLPGRGRPLALALVLVLGAALWHQRFWLDMGRGYPYGYFKVISLAAPVASLLVAAGARRAWRDARRLPAPARDAARLAVLSLGCTLLGASLTHLVTQTSFANRVWLTADRPTLEVQQAASLIPPGEPVLVVDERHPGRTWLLYLLGRPTLLGRAPNPGYTAQAEARSPEPVRYALIADPGRERGSPAGEPWFDPAAREVLWSNGRYALVRRADGALADLPLAPWGLDRPLVRPTPIDLAGGTLRLTLGDAPEDVFAQRAAGDVRRIEVVVDADAGAELLVESAGLRQTIRLTGGRQEVQVPPAGARLVLTPAGGAVRLLAVRALGAPR